MKEILSGVHGLLQEDGSLWLHVDARELGTAREVGDEVFGQVNLVGVITWEKTRRPSFLHAQLATVTDFILVYGKDRSRLSPFVDGTTQPGKRIPVAHRGNKVSEILWPAGSVAFNCADGLYEAGDHSSPGLDARLLEDMTVQSGRNLTPLRMSLPSRYSPSKITQLVAEGAEFLVPKRPFRPNYIAGGGKPKLINNLWSWQLDERMESNEDAARQQDRLFPGRPFPGAKPEGLLRRIIDIASESGDTVLDCFAGSGTTTAVAKAMGRRWIAIESSPKTVRDYLLPRMALDP